MNGNASLIDKIWRFIVHNWRLIPFLVFLAGIVAIVLAQIGIIPLSTPEQIIIGLLSFLAVEAFVERTGILNNIENNVKNVEFKVNRLLAGKFLEKRKNITSIPKLAAKASGEIWILGQSGLMIGQNEGIFKGKLADQAYKLRIILLNPLKPALDTLIKMVNDEGITSKFKTTIHVINRLINNSELSGDCKVKFADVFAPFSLFIVDPEKESGSMIVDYLHYKLTVDERPWFELYASKDPEWFGYYKQQYEKVWNDATFMDLGELLKTLSEPENPDN